MLLKLFYGEGCYRHATPKSSTLVCCSSSSCSQVYTVRGLHAQPPFGTTSLQPGSGPSAFDFVSASRFLLVPTTQVFLIIPDADGGLVVF